MLQSEHFYKLLTNYKTSISVTGVKTANILSLTSSLTRARTAAVERNVTGAPLRSKLTSCWMIQSTISLVAVSIPKKISTEGAEVEAYNAKAQKFILQISL